jgi:hypothetical protein
LNDSSDTINFPFFVGAPPPAPPVGQWLVEIFETPAGASAWKPIYGRLDAVRRRTDRDIQYGGDNLQVPIFEGKLKYFFQAPKFEVILRQSKRSFAGDTDELWKRHVKQDFPRQAREEMESYREMYLVRAAILLFSSTRTFPARR